MEIKPDYELDLKSIFDILKNNLSILILIPFLIMIVSFCINVYYLTPVYRASVTLMVKVSLGGSKNSLSYEDFLVARQLGDTYCRIAKSRPVLERVIAEGNLILATEKLGAKISAEVIRETQLITIHATDADPALAVYLANETARALIEEGKRIMEFGQLKIIEPATTPKAPVKPNLMVNLLVSLMMSLFLAVTVIFTRRWAYPNFESSEEISQVLGVPVLGNIPLISGAKSRACFPFPFLLRIRTR